jgi:acyl carrier protein
VAKSCRRRWRRIANTQIYILDRRFEPVPPGVAGELFIGGNGVVRGYLDRRSLTAEKFLPDPFSSEPGARLYRTGDLARFRADGVIEFLGRLDHQVKVRGYRIELGEIEAVLSRHPDIAENVVVAREDGQGDKRLVAYFVNASEKTITVNDLRGYLRERLPEYMIPAAFIALPSLPLTPNGKLNRLALPAPENLRPELEVEYVAPRTEPEQIIARIWQEVLHVEKPGVNDNFFDLGGNSLLLVRVHSKLREAFAKDISLIEMFRYPTINLLVKLVAQEEDKKAALKQAQDRAGKQLQARRNQQRRARDLVTA